MATFSNDSTYLGHTGWTESLDEAHEAIELIRLGKGRNQNHFSTRLLCTASKDLQTQTDLKSHRNIFLYTDGGRNNKTDECWESLADLDHAANWRITFFEATGDSMVRAKRRLYPRNSYDLGQNTSTTIALLEDIARQSNGLLTRFSDPDPSIHTDAGIRKGTTTIDKYQYFSVGKSTKKIKRNTSGNAINWTVADLGNGAKTRGAVSAVRLNGRTYVFHLGETSNTIYYSYSSNGTTWYGNAHVFTNYTRSVPKAIVVNGVIKVYFAHYQSGPTYLPQDVRYVQSTSINSNGSIVWSGSIDTGLNVPSAYSSAPGFYDPATNKEVLMIWSPSVGAYQLYESAPGQNNWSVRHTFTYGIAKPAFLNVNSDIFMAYLSTGGALRLAKESTNWSSIPIGSATSDAVPAIGHASDLVVVYLKYGDDDIMVTRSSNLGTSWTNPIQGTELTHDGLGMVAWTETVPLTGSIFGPYLGNSGVALTWTASGSGGDSPYSYTWKVDGVTVGTGNSLTRTFMSDGIYELRMTVTDNASDTYTVYRYITIGNGCTEFLPCIE